jgi:hypothetical protein
MIGSDPNAFYLVVWNRPIYTKNTLKSKKQLPMRQVLNATIHLAYLAIGGLEVDRTRGGYLGPNWLS